MNPRFALLIALGSLAWGQSVATQKTFLHYVDSFQAQKADGPPIDPLPLLQEELGVSATTAEAVLATVRDYNAEADKVEMKMRRSILSRRLQIAGEFQVTYSGELDLVNWANLDLNLFLLEQMDEPAARLGEGEYQKLVQFMQNRILLLPAGGGWKQSPLGFWRDSIKGPLSGPDAETLFVRNYRDAALPPQEIVYYLEGTVVSVTHDDTRKVLLSMQGEGAADAGLLIDGVDWKLTSEPKKGEIVRFTGVAREFTREPFLILFAPTKITGLSVDSVHPNPPFTIPGLAR